VDRRRQVVAHTPPFRPRVRVGRSSPERYHNAFWPLAEPFSNKHLEPFLARVTPLGDESLAFVSSEPQTFAFVLQGEMEFRAKTGNGMRVERLAAGDALFWDSWVPHSSRAVGADPTEVLCVLHSAYGAPGLVTELASALTGASHTLFHERETESVAAEVGHRIALVRQAHGLSVAQVARAVGLSPRQLTAIENGVRPAPIDTLYRLAHAFQRPFAYFLPQSGNDNPAFTVRKKRCVLDGPAFSRADGTQPGAVYRPLIAGSIERGLHPYLVRFSSGVPPASAHLAGQQFVYVLNGEVEFTIHDGSKPTRELLRPGDSVYFHTDFPHQMAGVTQSPFATHAAEAIAVFWSPVGGPGLVPVSSTDA
jgi:HTH-type transcriptional repressor of puuD